MNPEGSARDGVKLLASARHTWLDPHGWAAWRFRWVIVYTLAFRGVFRILLTGERRAKVLSRNFMLIFGSKWAIFVKKIFCIQAKGRGQWPKYATGSISWENCS